VVSAGRQTIAPTPLGNPEFAHRVGRLGGR
jgi:hypothetical protein